MLQRCGFAGAGRSEGYQIPVGAVPAAVAHINADWRTGGCFCKVDSAVVTQER